MGPDVDIVYLNLDIVASYCPSTKIILLSTRLRDYPELHDFCLEHEKAHADIDTSQASKLHKTLEHVKLEYRDRWKLYSVDTLSEQRREIESLNRRLRSNLDVFEPLYGFATMPTSFYPLLQGCFSLLRRVKRLTLQIKEFLSGVF